MTVPCLPARSADGDLRLDLDLIARQHTARLLGLALRITRDPYDAQDAVQRGLEILVRHRHRLRPGSAPAWLTVVIRHEALGLARVRAREIEFVDDCQPQATGLHGDELCDRLDLVTRARQDLPRLKAAERRALGLKALGFSYQEIVGITGWTYTKVNRCVSEGRRSLRHSKSERSASSARRSVRTWGR